MRLHLIRHPKPRVQAGICYGRSDVPLQDPVASQAARLEPLLPKSYVLYSSPLSRALTLARELGTPRIDPRLQEMNFGDWELAPYERYTEEVHQWAQDPLGYRIPGGETGLEVAQRIWSFHQDLMSTSQDKDIVVVGHSGPFRLWLMQVLEVPLAQQHVFQLDFAKMTKLEVQASQSRLTAMNL